MSEADTILEAGSLRITGATLDEMQDGVAVASVKRSEVRGAHLHYGFLARHPVLQIAFGVGLFLISGWLLLPALTLFFRGVILLWGVWPVPFAGLGLWVVYDASRRGYFLEVQTQLGRNRLMVGNIGDKDFVQLRNELRRMGFPQ